MKHSPAPWKFRPVPFDSMDGKTSYWIDLENGAPIADVRRRPDDEHVANARLIAAAPELLNQLDNAETLIVALVAGEEIPPALLENTLYEIHQAIVKVKGQS